MSRTEALVLVGHGSQRHPDSSAPLFAHAERIRERGIFEEVHTAFWKEEPALWDVRHVVEADVAYVVPALTSEGYFADEVFPRELGVGYRESGSSPWQPELRYAEPVGTHESMTDVLADRVEGAIEGPASEVGVAVVGHGTERNANSAAATERHAAALSERDEYAEVTALFLDEAPFVADVIDHLDADELVVVPFFVADGYHASRDVPDAMGHPGIGQTATVSGRTVHYTGAVGTEPSLADVLIERAIEAGATNRSGRRPDDGSQSKRAFVEWVDASTTGRKWGELVVAGDPDGYELRHREDATTSRDTLETVHSPAALRQRVRHEDHGRYRPLAGAATLPTGWVHRAADAAELARAIRTVYPASVEHWYRELTGDLRVTDVEETVRRQTGVYGELDGLDQNELAAATEAVCGTCARRRRWVADVDEPRGEPRGEIPCREACPFFLTATHAFLESDGEAADEPDPEVSVYALSNSANEYRVRYATAREGHRETDGPTLTTDGGSP